MRFGVVADVVRGRVHPRDAVHKLADRPPAPRRSPVLDPGAPAMLLSPHLDDAVLSCWSQLTGAGEVVVVNVFAGMPPAGMLARYDLIARAASSASRMHERLEEDREALALAGRAPINLEFLESAYRTRAPATAHLLAALERRVPAASAVLAPAAIGMHPDHALVRAAALRLADAGLPLTLYADVPYCVAYGWPPWVTGAPGDPYLDVDAHWSPALAPLCEAYELLPQAIALDAPAQQAKLAALRRYRTQYPALSRGPLDVLAAPAVLGFELQWTVTGTSSRRRPAGSRAGRGSTRAP